MRRSDGVPPSRSGAAALVRAVAFVATLALGLGAAQADEPAQSVDGEEEKPEFTEAYLADEANVARGKALWTKQCRHCHGASAYPGKAPKLKPRKYTPDFIFNRVTNGFRKMPPWKSVYTLEERMAVVAYVKSRSFSP